MRAWIRQHPGAFIGLALPALFAVFALIWIEAGAGGPVRHRAPTQAELRRAARSFEAHNDLEDLLARSVDDLGALPAFYDALLGATVWVTAEGDVSQARAAGRSSMRFRHVDFGGASMLPLYTSRARVPDDVPASSVGTLPVSTILEHLEPESPIVVNPGSALPRPISLAEVRELRARALGEGPRRERGPEPLAPLPLLEPASLAEPLPGLSPLLEPASAFRRGVEGSYDLEERPARGARAKAREGAGRRTAPSAAPPGPGGGAVAEPGGLTDPGSR